MNQLFFHTNNSDEAQRLLLLQNYKPLPAPSQRAELALFIVLCKEDKVFWPISGNGLANQNELAQANYNQNILPITLNEIQSWEN